MHNLLLNNFIYVFFPERCLRCAEELIDQENGLCVFCAQELTPLNYGPLFLDTLGSVPCFGLYRYEEKSAAQLLIHNLKYKHKVDIGILLGYQLAKSILRSACPQLLLPVPLSSKKRWTRGYNQSEFIAKGFSNFTNIPFSNKYLKRVRNSVSQTHLSKAQRMRNVEGAFRLSHPIPSEITHVGIVDDVVTTGATALQIVNVLIHEHPHLQITIFAAAIAN
jgi:ComF family protein